MLFFTFNANGQSAHEILESFTLVQNGNNVLANFSVKGGASCNGVTLERRVAGDTDYTISGQIQGVCGGSEFTEHYSIQDESPELAEQNFYRLKLGTQGYSRESDIVVIELLGDYNIYPQPAANEVFVKFDNPNNESAKCKVYDSKGLVVYDKDGFNNDIIFIDSTDLISGMYFFQIQFTEQKLLTGKFILNKTF